MERDALVETAAGLVGVGLFVAAALVLGTLYTHAPDDGGQLLSETGAHGLVAAVAGFVVLMSLIGYALSRR
jgi:hypothetical protein